MLAVRRAGELGGHAPSEDPLARLRARVADAADRLSAEMMTRAAGPLSERDCRALAGRAVGVAAAAIRGLNDCLNAGTLGGYLLVTEGRVAAQVHEVAGAPSLTR